VITIVEYGMGNVGSILNMLARAGAEAQASSDPEVIRGARKLILPGVGAFDTGMVNLRSLGLLDPLNQAVLVDKVPVLGICLGMQLLGLSSEEGAEPGLGWVDARAVRFRPDPALQLKVPHMGWNEVALRRESTLFHAMFPHPRFYFVHSYHCVCANPEHVVATSVHGESFVASLRSSNIYGVQFHPEKSHKFGMRLLDNFARL
jgi:glutamine amidotransferase